MLGSANVGKSTFINTLIRKSNRYYKKEKHTYEKNYDINEPSLLEKAEEKSNKNELTCSPLPGTTIGITKVESISLGVKLYDTPGIPNHNSITYNMNEITDIISATIKNKIIPYSINLKQGYSVWIGALARVDFLNGEDKYFSFFFSHHVTIHRTPMLLAEDVFNRQAGKLLRPIISTDINELNLTRHTLNLKCDKFSLLNYDVSISGLGWFSISGRGLMQIDVYVPQGTSLFLRTKPLMPYEIKTKGVKKYFGKTINSNSKINRNFSRNNISKKK